MHRGVAVGEGGRAPAVVGLHDGAGIQRAVEQKTRYAGVVLLPVGVGEDQDVARAFHPRECEHIGLRARQAEDVAPQRLLAAALHRTAVAVTPVDAVGAAPEIEISVSLPGAVVDGRTVCAGNLKLMHKIGAKPVERDASGTVIYTAVDGKYMGCIEIADTPKEGAKKAVEELNNDLGIRTVMLTGDRKAAAKNIADALGIAEFHAELLPQNKVEIVEQELAKENGKRSVAFVGDGINDAPVIARADVGLAMGGLGSDAAIEAADIVIMDDRIEKVPLAVRIARRTVRIAWQNIIFALAVKLATLLLGALGYAEMWMALVADVGVCLIAILNAMRAMHPGK